MAMPTPIAPAPSTATTDSRAGAALNASASGEARRPLGEERRDAFPVVVAGAKLALEVPLEVELRDEIVAGARVQGTLDCREAARGRRGELDDEALGGAGKLGVINALPDQP